MMPLVRTGSSVVALGDHHVMLSCLPPIGDHRRICALAPLLNLYRAQTLNGKRFMTTVAARRSAAATTRKNRFFLRIL